MKKIMIFLLVAILLVTAGCGAQQDPVESTTSPVPETTAPVTEPSTEPATEPSTEPPTEPSTEAPTEPTPECVNAVVQADNAPAILMLLDRGVTVDIVGEYDEGHWIVKTESGYGLVEKQLLKLSGEPAYEVWCGYATSNAALYASYQLTGEPLGTLSLNDRVEVLDELNYCYVVKLEEGTGYIQKEQVSKYYIQYSGKESGNDGGDISLSDRGGSGLRYGGVVTLSAIKQSGDVTGTAEVLADGTQVILDYYDREELASVIIEAGFAPDWEGYYTLYVDGMYAYLPENLAQMEGEEAYAQWDGFAGYSARVYANRLLQGESTGVGVNTAVTILWDGGDFYVVSIDGNVGYMRADQVSAKRYSTGGSDWTPPVM